MSKVILPYILQEGQVAYAARVMANFNALLDKINQVTVPGLTQGDVEAVLIQLKQLLDTEMEKTGKVVADMYYDAANEELVLLREDGGRFAVSMSPFINEFLGSTGSSIDVGVDGSGVISANLKNDGVAYDMLAAAVREKLEAAVVSGKTGNAAEIVFTDGETMQEKMDNGDFDGKETADVAVGGFYYLEVREDGHLYLITSSESTVPPLSINDEGHLIYTLE